MDQGWIVAYEYYIDTYGPWSFWSFSFLFWWISPKAVGELSGTDRPVRFQGSVGGFSSSAAAVYRHLFFCGAESDPAALFECLEMNRFRGNDRGFRARARRECEPPIVSTAFRARSRIFPYEWNAVRFVDRIWRILKRNSKIPCLG